MPIDISQLQPRAWKILARSCLSERLAPAYLLHGRPGVGAWYTALSLAALLNCEDRSVNDDDVAVPCGSCRYCRTIYNVNSELVIPAVPIGTHKTTSEMMTLYSEVLDARRQAPLKPYRPISSAHIPVEMARDVKRQISRKPDVARWRVVVFYQMERMLTSSADALLKLIEEPPRNTVIVMTCRRPDSLLPTIQSRSQKIKLGNNPSDFIRTLLQKEHGLSEDAATLYARLSDGSVGLAIEMAEQAGEEDSSRNVGMNLFKSLLLDDSATAMSNMNELLAGNDRGEAESLLALWQSLVRDCTMFAATGDRDKIANVDFGADVQRLSMPFAQPQTAPHVVNNIKFTLADIGRNVHIQTALMAMVLRIKSGLPAAR